MKKFIVAFDGLRFSQSAANYAVELAKENSAHLVGIFLDDPMRHNYNVYDLILEEGDIATRHRVLEQADINKRKEASMKFEKSCQAAGLNYTIHHDKNKAIAELIHETVYADLLIIYNGETISSHREKLPGQFVRQLLGQVQCPVLLVPFKFKPITKLVLLYDGEPSSVFAIKMLSYTLAYLKQKPTEIISVRAVDDTSHVPDNTLMKEFTKRHFPNANYTVLKGIPEHEIVNYLKQQKINPLIVLGAYRRGVVSRLFRASMADLLMREFKLPLFIAHTRV